MKFEKYITDDIYKERGKNKPTPAQTKVLKKMLKNHKDKVVTSFMKGKNMYVETQSTDYNITPDGKGYAGFHKGD